MGFLNRILSMFKKEEKKDAPEPQEKKDAPEPEFGLDEEMLGNGVSVEPKEDDGMSGLFGAINGGKEEEPEEKPEKGSAVPEEPPFASENGEEPSQK